MAQKPGAAGTGFALLAVSSISRARPDSATGSIPDVSVRSMHSRQADRCERE